ncbi:sulfatase-like hydrolase/transferase [Granulicella rosea]|uniref:sulfatase-like hydrolase/transferase n=1 Tax=Granulicella rosea TaxID=474952 RepID=UPI0015952A38|nr:sulfatase-like hydrolase/transferase [Granulicella rosea]
MERSAMAKAPSKPAKKPNILWIMSDEHNATVAGCYGNKLVQTPHIDSLAQQGITFDAHYCNSPLCVPSRLSLTAGKYASRVDIWGLTCELPDANIASLPRVLNSAGYESFLCGKQHYDYSRRYGFTEVGGDFNKTYKTGRGRRLPPTHLKQAKLSPRFDEFHAGDHGSTVEHDRRVTAGAVDFLSKREDADEKPFFLFVGYLAPHFPLIVPQENVAKYRGKVGMPEIPEGFLDRIALNYKVQRAGFEEIGVPDDTVRSGRELYYGLVDWADQQIGHVLAALRAHPEVAENTVIIYSSDHGENMGERGLWWKNCMYDSASKVPLVISWPKRWKGQQRRGGASSHLDLVQTIVELAGTRSPNDWNGESMLHWMDRPNTPWKDLAVSEYYAHNTASGYTMIRSGEWKYVYHNVIDEDHPAQRELYNLAHDPKEFTNLANLPEHKARVETLHQRMLKEVGADPDEIEKRSREQLARGYTRPDPKPAWAVEGENG